MSTSAEGKHAICNDDCNDGELRAHLLHTGPLQTPATAEGVVSGS